MYLLQVHPCVRSMERKIKEGRRQASRQERGKKKDKQKENKKMT